MDQMLAIAACASRLLAWMRANVGDEPEPEAQPGYPMGLFLISLCDAAEPSDAADLAFLLAAREVLKQYGTHTHAVIRVPTPKDAALEAAERIAKKRLPDPPPPSEGQPVSVAVERLSER